MESLSNPGNFDELTPSISIHLRISDHRKFAVLFPGTTGIQALWTYVIKLYQVVVFSSGIHFGIPPEESMLLAAQVTKLENLLQRPAT